MIAAGEITQGVNLTSIIIAVVASGSFTAWLSWFLSRSKSEAETEGIVADTYSQVLADMRTELQRYQTMLEHATLRISALESRETRSQRRLRQLEKALHDEGIPIPPQLDHTTTPPYGQTNLWGDQPRGNEEDPTPEGEK